MPMVPQPPKLARVQKSQAPIFQAKPHLAAKFANAPKVPSADIPAPEPLPLVTPLTVFAAGKSTFRAIVRANVSKNEALAMIFAVLPLHDNGWNFEKTAIDRCGTAEGHPVFELRKG